MSVADFLTADCRASLSARHAGAHEAPTSVRRWVDGVGFESGYSYPRAEATTAVQLK